MYSSQQERLLHAASSRGFGFPYAFVPDLYLQGKEPADLLLLAGDTMFIVNCTEGNKSLEKQIKHNLKQARTFLKKWTNDVTIKNADHKNEGTLKRQDFSNFVIVSVTGSQEKICKRFGCDLFEKSAGVRAKFSIEFEALAQLFEVGGNCIDLLRFSDELRSGPLHVDDLIVIFSRWTRPIRISLGNYMSESPPNSIVSQGVDHSFYDKFTLDYVQRLKSQCVDKDITMALMSIGCVEIFWIAATLSIAGRTVGQVLPGQTGQVIQIWQKDFVSQRIVVAAYANMRLAIDHVGELSKHMAAPSTIVFQVIFDVMDGVSIFTPMVLVNPPFRLPLLLEAWIQNEKTADRSQ